MDPTDDPGSSDFRNGFALAWGVAIASIVAAVVVGMVLGEVLEGRTAERSLIAGVLPPLAMLGLLAGCWFNERKRMALGVLAAFGSMFAVLLLGIAACFGLIGFGGF
jgi:cytochrome bd-type quinol oxidase subunit 2